MSIAAEFQNQTLAEIVKADLRSTNVFEKYGLDYCCEGRISLEQACQKNGLDPSRVAEDLSVLLLSPPSAAPAYERLEPDALSRHIMDRHHAYVRNQSPILKSQLKKIAAKHGATHPELPKVEQFFALLQSEIDEHMFKEEKILFPYIDELSAHARRPEGPPPECPFGSVKNPILAMEHDHRAVGRLAGEIRKLTGDYRIPEDACPAYRSALANLKAFEEDLHLHIHLENNVLHPKALALEAH